MRTEHYLEYIIYGFAILFTVLALLIFCRILRFCVNYLRYLVFNPNNDIATSTSLTKNNKKKHFNKEDENIEKNKEKEENQQLMQEETQIVGIAEPVGKWTKYVTEQKVSWLRAMVGTKSESDNFWQNMVQAQERAQGKQKGRSSR